MRAPGALIERVKVRVKAKELALALVLVWCGNSLQGCKRNPSIDGQSGAVSTQAPKSPEAPKAETAGLPSYPPASWRLALFEDLQRTTLWVGHIVVRHRGSDPTLFRGGDWRPDAPAPARTPAEARAIAEGIAAKLAVAPDQFEELARAHSDDILTREAGGRLGGIRASDLVTTDFLDALATLKVGDVSRPFETPYGIHILKRYAPPREEQVAGRRIVIGYRGAFSGGPNSQRSHDEALALATKIANEARQNPQSFESLVEKYSENADRSRQGQMGVYSTLDPGDWPGEIDQLARLAVGQVTGPVDGRVGFEILMRVPVVPQKAYAMTSIKVPIVNGPLGEDPAELEAARLKALETVGTVRLALEEHPDRLKEFQDAYCCDRVQRWVEGRGQPELTQLLDSLAFGEIAKEPIQLGGDLLLVKRLDPTRLPPEKPRLTELPLPSEPDYKALLQYNSEGLKVAAASRGLVETIRGSGGLAPETAPIVAKALEQLAARTEQLPADRGAVRAAVYATLASLERDLGADGFAAFMAFGRAWIKGQLMPTTAPN